MDSIFVAVHVVELVAIFSLAALVLGAYHYLAELQTALQSVVPTASRLEKGDTFPIDLGSPLPPRTFLVMVSHGCSGCVDLCKRLDGVQLGPWQLLVMVSGPLTQPKTSASGLPLAEGAPLEPLPLPRYAQLVHDPQRAWFKQLGARAYPSVLALVGGRLVDQRVMPPTSWFLELIEKREAKGRAITTGSSLASEQQLIRER